MDKWNSVSTSECVDEDRKRHFLTSRVLVLTTLGLNNLIFFFTDASQKYIQVVSYQISRNILAFDWLISYDLVEDRRIDDVIINGVCFN